jgi:hypothetical protein
VGEEQCPVPFSARGFAGGACGFAGGACGFAGDSHV